MTPEQSAVIEAAREWRRPDHGYRGSADALCAAVDALDAAEQSTPEPDVDPDADVHLLISHLVADVGRLRDELRETQQIVSHLDVRMDVHDSRADAMVADVADVGRLREGLSSVRERLDAWVHDVADHRRRIEALEVNPNVYSHDTPLPEWLTYAGWGQWESTVPYDPATGMPTTEAAAADVEPEPERKPKWRVEKSWYKRPRDLWLWDICDELGRIASCYGPEDAERIAAALNAQEGS